MSELEVIAITLVTSMVNEGRVTENQARLLLRFLLQEDFISHINLNSNHEEITQQLIRRLDEVSIKVSIPPNEQQNDLSSPLDSFLLSKKKISDRNSAHSPRGSGNLIHLN